MAISPTDLFEIGLIVPSLEKAGMKIVTNAYPHNWTWHLSVADGSPWKDVRVRKAANLAWRLISAGGAVSGTM